MAKNNGKSQVLGDDPLAWLSAGSAEDKKTVKKKSASKKKRSGKAKTESKKDKVKKEKTKEKTKEKKEKVESAADKESNQFMLEASSVINKAGDIHGELKKLSESGKDVTIDASQVEIIDSAILQLLFSFAISLKKSGVELTWHKPTDSLLNKASILGLTEKLGL